MRRERPTAEQHRRAHSERKIRSEPTPPNERRFATRPGRLYVPANQFSRSTPAPGRLPRREPELREVRKSYRSMPAAVRRCPPRPLRIPAASHSTHSVRFAVHRLLPPGYAAMTLRRATIPRFRYVALAARAPRRDTNFEFAAYSRRNPGIARPPPVVDAPRQ